MAKTTIASRVGLLRHRYRVRPRPRNGIMLAQRVLAEMAESDPSKSGWTADRVLQNLSEFRCVPLVDGTGAPAAILKLARGAYAETNLRRNEEGLSWLAGQPDLAGWRRVVPSVLAAGTVDGFPYLVEEWIPGFLGDGAGSDVSSQMPLLEEAAAATAELQRLTAVPSSSLVLERSVDAPIRTLAATVPVTSPESKMKDRICGLETRLRSAAADRPGAVSHSDYWLGNVFFRPGSNHLTGIIDWSGYRVPSLADVDLVTLVLTARLLRGWRELGDAVLAVLSEGWEPWERHILETFSSDGSGWATDPAAATTAWLWLVTGNMEKDTRFSAGTVWFYRNVGKVLESFDGQVS